MRTIVSILLLLLALPCMAAVTGDPVDGNELPTTGTVEEACRYAETYPACQPCWTTCFYAMMAEAYMSGDWDWDW